PMPLDARGRPVPPVDPFMRIATLDALVEAGGPLALKTLFVAGLGVIFLSHTPLLWRL
ncbi:DNA-binding protein, partial [Nguyenibacter vanlangensis]|nr:DNA-binding protein [Nguyenibacter vanlangensis]